MNWTVIINLLLQILPIILNLLPKVGPNTLKKYAPQLQQIRASAQALDEALGAAGVNPSVARAMAAPEEDFTK